MAFILSWLKPLAYISVPVLVVRSIVTTSPKGRYYVRLGVYLGLMGAIATWGFFVAAGMYTVGQQYDVNWVIARAFYAIGSRALDVEIEIEGEEHLQTKPAVLMINHQSMFDILFVGRLMPKRTCIMSKQSLKISPVGPFMTLSGAIFIDRGNNARAVKSLKVAGEQMRDLRLGLWMFPEGTRHSAEAPDLLPFKKGGFHLAIQAGIPIIPMVAENYWRIYHKGFFGTGKLKVRVLPPVETTGLTTEDVPALVVRVRDQMLETLRDISVKVPSGQTEKTNESPRDLLQATTGQSDAPSDSSAPGTGKHTAPPPHIVTEILPKGRASPESRELLTSSSSSSFGGSGRRSEASENGAETEEDEGMVLVGRPA